MSENAAAGIGVCALLVLVTIAVTIFILCGMKRKKYEFLEKEDIETAYGVSGMVKEKRDAYHSAYVTQLVIGIACCICSGNSAVWNSFGIGNVIFIWFCRYACFLQLVAVGTYFT